MKPYIKSFTQITNTPKSLRNWFFLNELRQIYNYPDVSLNEPIRIGVISFGGGLYGDVSSNGVLLNGDVQNLWAFHNIQPSNMPRVIIKPVNGASNSPNVNDGGATFENTLDVQTIGVMCPSSQVTIILYIGNPYDLFSDIMQHMIDDNLSLISISWGAPEVYFTPTELENENIYFKNFTDLGINISAASGDNGSNDGVGGNSNNCDFPTCSPYITACGGTHLVCPNYTYDSQTVETAWSSGGGAISRHFAKPSYQSELNTTGRSVPDIAMVADPYTGCFIKVNNQNYIIGGTSLVSPLFTGYLATINYKGFINERLYTLNRSCFNDITSGSNGGFIASIGYDNCTGLGSINGLSMLNFLNQVDTSNNTEIPTITPFSLPIGTSLRLSPLILPINTSNKNIQWSSSNETIATITNNRVTGISNGVVKITATIENTNITTNFDLTVYTKISSINLNISNITLNKNTTYQINPNISPIDPTDPTLFYKSSDNNIATVSTNGLITAISKGSCIISCESWDGLTSSQIYVSVIIPITSITIQNSLRVRVGQTITLSPTILPSDANKELIYWTSSKPPIATVNNGIVKCLRKGSTIMKISTIDNLISAYCLLVVF